MVNRYQEIKKDYPRLFVVNLTDSDSVSNHLQIIHFRYILIYAFARILNFLLFSCFAGLAIIVSLSLYPVSRIFITFILAGCAQFALRHTRHQL